MRLIYRISDVLQLLGEPIPWYMGYAFHSAVGPTSVYAIIPLNVVIGYGRRVWMWIAEGVAPGRIDKKLSEAIRREYMRGVIAGVRHTKRAIVEEAASKETLYGVGSLEHFCRAAERPEDN